ncbi:MAG: lipoate--protein ligase family protein [Aeoliella sp.]
MTPCRLIVDPPQLGAWNMAVDEWLLHLAADEGIVSLRFYEWAEPTLSLGYFQRHADRQQHAASLDCPLVRRRSGGGALAHDRELTYSLAVPADHPLAQRAEALYFTVHDSLVELLRPLADPSAGNFVLCEKQPSRGDDEPFLCFSRRARGDLLFAQRDGGQRKICGSAQRRHRGAVLQHGGILLARSPTAPELPGLEETAGIAITAPELGESWLDALTKSLQLSLQSRHTLQSDEQVEVERLSRKFRQAEWNQRR